MADIISREEKNQMRWAARRGMLELDLVLEPFVTQCYETLSSDDRDRFRRLMLCEDQDLFAWLLQRSEPDDEEMKGIVAQIVKFTRASAPNR
jgi:antitoxin CptB